MRASFLVVALVFLTTGCSHAPDAQHLLTSLSAAPLPTQAVASPSPVPVNRLCFPDAEQPAPPPGLPPDAICVSSAHGNFDGLSANESMTTYSLRRHQQPLPWYVRVELGTGRELTADLKTLYRDPYDVFVIGVADARDDGRDEAFIVLTHGASTDFVGILGMDGPRLALATTPSSQQGFAVSGSVMHQGILQCLGTGTSARLVASGWGSNDAGKTFNWESTTYSWSGMRLITVSSRNGTVPSSDDPQLTALGRGLHCHGLTGLDS